MQRTKIRLLCFFREYFPTQRVDVDVLFGKELCGRGHDIDCVAQAATQAAAVGPQQWYGRTAWIGPTDARPGFFRRLHKHVLGIVHDVRSLRLIDPRRYDAVQVMDKFPFAYLALRAARRRGVKFYFWLSFPFPEAELIQASERTARYPWAARLRGRFSSWLLYRKILPQSDHVFVQSAQMKTDVSAHGIDPDKLTPVPMGVSLTGIEAFRPPARADAQRAPRLAYLGTLAADRRLTILIDMLAELHRTGCEAHLTLVGDADVAEHRLMLERRAASLGMTDFVRITGFLPRSQAIELVRQADIAISPFFPSPLLRSTSPTKIVEYMALGMPVIANHHPEQRRALRESRAGVCVPWRARHFARAVRWIMSHNEAQRAALGARGRRWVEANRDYRKIADRLEQSYLDLAI